MIIAHVAVDASVDSISFGFSGLRTCPNEAARTLCKTSQGRSITCGDFVESRLRQMSRRRARCSASPPASEKLRQQLEVTSLTDRQDVCVRRLLNHFQCLAVDRRKHLHARDCAVGLFDNLHHRLHVPPAAVPWIQKARRRPLSCQRPQHVDVESNERGLADGHQDRVLRSLCTRQEFVARAPSGSQDGHGDATLARSAAIPEALGGRVVR